METVSQDPAYGGDRLQFFNVQEPFSLPVSEFEVRWRDVDNVWVQFGTTKTLKKNPDGWTKSYDCRFKKRHASGTKKPDIPADKRRKTSQRHSILCNAQITLTLKNGVVTVRKTSPDSPDHTHDLKASDVLKAPSSVIDFVETESYKGYRAPAVRKATQDQFNDKEVGVQYLSFKTVLNAQRKVHGGLDAPFVSVNDLEEDLKNTLEWPKSNNYNVEEFGGSGYRGFAFASEENLEALRKSGHLTIMDSTHKTNKHSWKLYTLLVRDAFGSWVSGGHFFVSGEEQHTVAKGLQVIKRWARSWQPRYFIIDQSAVEENAVNYAFRGIEAGEQNVTIFYCTWHCRRTLQRRLESFGKGYHLMLQAMYKITRTGCEQLVHQAIARLPLEPEKTYIRRYWLGNTEKWAMWSRQHSPLLLQITSTSPVESYHAVLKRNGDASFGLIGACKVTHNADRGYFDRATKVRLEFRTKSITEAKDYPFLLGFPNPVQILLLDEILGFQRRLEEGKPMPDNMGLECNCQFFRRYLLPCRHLFHCNLAGDFITDENWAAFRGMFEESGFNVYTSRMRVAIEQEEDPRQMEVEQRRLEFYAVIEEAREQWFALEATFRQNDDSIPLRNLIARIRDAAVLRAL